MQKLKYFIVISILYTLAKTDNLDSFINSMNNKMDDFVSTTLKMFSDFDDNCSVPTYYSCQGVSEVVCYEDFPTIQQNCLYNGSMLSKKSGVALPGTASMDNLTNQQKHLICSTARLQDFFQSIQKERNHQILSTYIATITGITRLFPTMQDSKFVADGSCITYDPRFRPWYASAVSGKKNLVLMFDNSNSVQQELQTMKIAARKMVGSLSTNDTVAVISMGKNVTSLIQKQMVKVNEDYRSKFTDEIQKISTSGSSNYTAGFQMAFKMLKQTKDQEELCCQYSDRYDVILLLMTDGASKLPEDSAESLKKYISLFENEFNIQLFIYSFSEKKKQYQQLVTLSCEYKGMHINILTSDSQPRIISKMQTIYTFLAKGQQFENPTWSEFYEDITGLGRMITIAKPIYYLQGQFDYLIGVVGIDIPSSQWDTFKVTDSQILRRLRNNNYYKISDQDTCSHEEQRPLQSRCDCPNITSSHPEFKHIQTSKILAQPITTKPSLCCGLTKQSLAGILGGIGGFIAITVGVLVYCFCCKNNKLQQTNNNQSPQTQVRALAKAPLKKINGVLFPVPPADLFDDDQTI